MKNKMEEHDLSSIYLGNLSLPPTPLTVLSISIYLNLGCFQERKSKSVRSNADDCFNTGYIV